MQVIGDCRRCVSVLGSTAPSLHPEAECGWADLAAECPDCDEIGADCTFFSDSVGDDMQACDGLSRLVALCLRCHAEGFKRRHSNQFLSCITDLCKDADEPSAFAVRHVDRYLGSVKYLEGVWLPKAVPAKDSEFFWDRSTRRWRFSLKSTPGSQGFTMERLLSFVSAKTSSQPVAIATPSASVRGSIQETVESLAAKYDSLSQKLEAFMQLMTRQQQRIEAIEARNEASEAGQSAAGTWNQARARTEPPQRARAPVHENWSPANTFAFGSTSANNMNPAVSGSVDSQLVRDLANSGFCAEEIVAAVRGRTAGAQPMEHRAAWSQVTQGTSPLCVFTGMDSEMRELASPKTLNVQTYDSNGNKLSAKVTAWPAASPDLVPGFRFAELGGEWKRALIQANLLMNQITPIHDRSSVPMIPEDVDKFISHCISCMKHHSPASVLRAWNAAHGFVLDEYIRKRSAPTWDHIWMMPVFQVELDRGTVGAMGAQSRALSPTKAKMDYCTNWNTRSGRRCQTGPECSKQHVCMRCDGTHRFVECTSRE